MRIPSSMLSSNINTYLSSYLADLNKQNDDIASGVRLHKPSDSPYEVSQSLNYGKSIGENEQWMSNMENGLQWIANTSETLGHTKDIVQQIYSKAVQGANDSMNEGNRLALSQQINAQLEEVLKMGNDTYLGKYLFNGDATNVPPFLGIRNSDGELEAVAQFVRFEGGNPNNPIYAEFKNTTGGVPPNDPDTLDGVYYDKNGTIVQTIIDDPEAGNKSISGELNRRTAENNYVNIAINGGDVFQPNGSNGDGDIFKTIIDLRNAFRNNNSDEIGTQITKLNTGMERITSNEATAGTIYNRMDLAKEIMASDEITLTDALSNIKDTDIANAMMEYTRLQTTYNMALQISMQISQTSLINFM